MNIEKIEEVINRWYEELSTNASDAKQSELVPMMVLSLLLAIYRKLESIDVHLASMDTEQSKNDTLP